MNGQITIPVWFFIVLVVLTAWLLLERLLAPSVRWFMRRRINRVLNEIGARLDIEIRPFQLTKRQVLIDRLVYDPKVMEAIQHFSRKDNKPREVLQAEVYGYAREIVPSFNAYLYFRIGYWLAKKVARLLYSVRLGQADEDQFSGIDPESTVVFVMNHRSNMDYILVAFLAAERTTLSYAVGEWARIWPLQTLIRSMGAFFVRRNSGNPLYRLVLERYIRMATKEGVCQAVFLEGGLSRDGRLREPRFGILDYMLRSYEPETDRDVIFIPVGINYDRIIEDRSLLYSLKPDAGRRSLRFVLGTTFGFIFRQFFLMALGRWRRYGYASVNFGRAISAREYCLQRNINFLHMDRYARKAEIEKLARDLMQSIEQVIPALPVPLISTVLLKFQNSRLDTFDINSNVHKLVGELKDRGGRFHMPRASHERALEHALQGMKIRRLVLESGGYYTANPEMIDILTYYANSIKHLLPDVEEKDFSEPNESNSGSGVTAVNRTAGALP